MWRGAGLVLGGFLWLGAVSALAGPRVVGGRYRFSSVLPHRDRSSFGPDLGFRAVRTNDSDRFQAIQLDHEGG